MYQKGENVVKLQKHIFSKITEIAHWASFTEAAYSEHSIAVHSSSMASYVTTVPAFVCRELQVWEASIFCDKKKMNSFDFTTYFSILTQANLCFLDVRNKDN